MVITRKSGADMDDMSADNVALATPDFARRLRSLRQAYGDKELNATQFAEVIGVPAERYRRYERGDSEPNLSTLRAIRIITGTSLCTLIAGLPPGDPATIPGGIYEPTLGDRIRWTRQIFLRDEKNGLRQAADLLGVDTTEWAAIERDERAPSIKLLNDFAYRFSVTTDFLISGRLTGVHPKVLAAFRHTHPELLTAVKRAEDDEESGKLPMPLEFPAGP